MKRLVTFLGTGRYETTCYRWDERGIKTPYVAHAIAELWRVDEVVVLATEEAEAEHGKGLEQALAGSPSPEFRRIPPGREEKELWKQFEVLTEVLALPAGELIVDITHGFRSQPFFAAGALAYLRMAGILEGREVSVLYGRYLREEPETSPIWNLTPFVELIEWAQGAVLFAEAGHADRLLKVLEGREKALKRRLAAQGSERFPRTGPLVSALQAFAKDLATVRIASLITGYAQNDPAKAEGSAERLLDALSSYGEEAVAHLPALKAVLDKIRHIAEGLSAPGLATPEGERAMACLARRYLDLHRYPEAAIVLREALVSRYADRREAVEVNCPAFDREAREAAERAFGEQARDVQRQVADVRNDIEHGGFRRQPLGAKALVERLEELIQRHLDEVPPALEGKTWFVSRHPGAVAWAKRHGIAVDRQVEHLDVGEVGKGDTVIGTLPVHLAAEVCRRGARYLHLSLDIPPEARGRELDAEDLERFGARLEAFQVLLGC